MPLVSEVEFGAAYVYSPKGVETVSVSSRQLRDAVKGDRSLVFSGKQKRVIPHLVAVLRNKIAGSALEHLFVDGPILVPAPRSAPSVPHSLYPTKLICESMITQGMGSETRLLLERIKAVPKAAFAKSSDERPTVEAHYRSMRVDRELNPPASILVVDDIITRGTMSVACVSLLKDAFPDTKVGCFGLIRTMSGVEVTELLSICYGTIRRRGNWATRVP